MGQELTQANETLLEFERLIQTGGCNAWEGTLRTGVDLGTANIVLAVVDEQNRPVAGASYPSTVVRDGIVVESSETRTEGIPQVTGIRFDHVVLYEALPVKNTDIFQEILSITQMLSKHQITTDKIYFNESNEITLYFDNIRAKLGKDNLEEKVNAPGADFTESVGRKRSTRSAELLGRP